MIPAYEELYGATKKKREGELEEALEAAMARYGARGMSGRERSEIEAKAIRNFLQEMGLFRGQLGMQEVQRTQALEDVAAERGYRTKMTYAEWAQREKEQARGFEQQKEFLGLQQKWAQGQADAERKRQRRQQIYGGLLSLGMGAGLGALAPKALGATGAWGGALRGGLMGAPTAGQMLALSQFYPQTAQPTTQPAWQSALESYQKTPASWQMNMGATPNMTLTELIKLLNQQSGR